MSAISSLVRIWKISHLYPGCSFVWKIRVVFFSIKQSYLCNKNKYNISDILLKIPAVKRVWTFDLSCYVRGQLFIVAINVQYGAQLKVFSTYLVIYLDFHSAKRALWLVDFWSRALDRIQMYPNQDTTAQLLPARRLQQHVIRAWLNEKWRDLQHVLKSAWLFVKGNFKYIT